MGSIETVTRGKALGLAAFAALVAVALGADRAAAATLEEAPREATAAVGEEALSAAQRTSRRLRASASFSVPNPYVASPDSTDINIRKLTVFGDSYSEFNRKKFANWAEQLRNEGDVEQLVGPPRGQSGSFPKAGATAETVGTNHFKRQYNLWSRSSPTFAANDLTVAYLGHNDIEDSTNLAKAKADYLFYVKKIISKGATNGQQHLFLATTHDWGRNPAQGGDPGGALRARSLEWRDAVIATANGRKNVVVVDMFTAFEKIFENPKKYGLKNVKTAQRSAAATTALYDDGDHFGFRGQQLIKQVFEHYLTRHWDAAHTLAAGDQAAARLREDIDAGLVFSSSAMLTAEAQLGFSAFPVGEAALAGVGDDAAAADVSRAGFAEAYAPAEARDGGLGLNYDLGGGTRLGLVLASYGEDERETRELSGASGGVRSDSVALYLENRLGGLELGTRLAYSNDSHEHRVHDSLVGEGDSASFDGRTVRLSQRAGYPLRRDGYTLTPWVELAHGSRDVDDFTLSSPFVSDATYSVGAVSDTEASIGLSLASDPIALGAGTSLTLLGGVSYTHSLVRDDYELRIREEATAGHAQRETVERPDLRTLGLNLGAQLQIGEDLALGAGLSLTRDPAAGTAEAARVSLTYRF